MDITKIIDKYGPEIAKGLKIASVQVYDKMIWYTRINGIIGLVELLLMTVFGGITFYTIHKICKKNGFYNDGLFITFYMIAVILLAIIDLALIPSICKIISPEYWIINSIINKVSH